jgi:osmotically-inducible protein OsmY
MDISVDESLIDVGVKDGRVVLSGTVRSAADRSQAFTDAWVAGVKAVDHSALQVDWRAYEQPQEEQRYVPASNEEIEKAIKEAFLYDPRVNSFALKVDVEKGVATLTGVVDNLKAKEAAEENAMNTAGVQRVKNHVRVRPPNQPPDEEIETKVSLALKRDPFVERHDISPLVTNGMVYLYGTVDSAFERARAEDAAARINGVIAVRNNLTLEAPPEPLPVKSDWEILQDIQNELWWSPFVDVDEVEVEVNDGVATLSGTVDSYPERRAAEENAFEGGAISVRNGLEVDYGPPYSFP